MFFWFPCDFEQLNASSLDSAGIRLLPNDCADAKERSPVLPLLPLQQDLEEIQYPSHPDVGGWLNPNHLSGFLHSSYRNSLKPNGAQIDHFLAVPQSPQWQFAAVGNNYQAPSLPSVPASKS